MTTEAGVPLEEVKQLLTDATQQLVQTVATLNDIIEEAGQVSGDLTPESEPLIAQQCEDIETDGDGGEECKPVPRTTLWIAGIGVTAITVGAGVYLYTKTDLFADGFSFGAISNRASNLISDKASQTRKEMGMDTDDGDVDDDSITILGRIGHAATFAANLVLSSVVTSIGEKARTYLDVDEYVESAHERLLEVVKEPLESIQSAVQDAVENQVQAAKDAVQDQIASVQEEVAARVQEVTDSVSSQMEDVVGGLSEQVESAVKGVTDQMEDAVSGVADQVQNDLDDLEPAGTNESDFQ